MYEDMNPFNWTPDKSSQSVIWTFI